jgi:hypothetical protein
MKIPRLLPSLLVTGVVASFLPGQTYLGIFTAPVPEVLAAQFPDLLSGGRGLVVTGVVPGSPADSAVVRKHDVLVSYQQEDVESEAMLRARIRGSRPGTEVQLAVLRSGKVQFLKASLGKRAVDDMEGAEPRGRTSRSTAIGRVRSYASTDGSSAPTTISIGVDANKLTVRVSYVDSSGRRQQRRVSGTRDELARRLGDLPDDLRKDVLQKLDSAAALRNESPLFSLRLRPVATPTGEPRVQMSLFMLGKDGKVETVTVNAVPEVDAITGHLERLPPKVREKVVESLRKKVIPKLRVKVTRSL